MPFKPSSPLRLAMTQGNSFVHNDRLYVLAGRSGDANDTAQASVLSANLNNNGTLGAWRFERSIPLERFGAALAKNKQHIYVAGGVDASDDWSADVGYKDTIYCSELQGDSLGVWRALGPLPASLAFSSLIAIPGALVLIGGENESGPNTGVWIAKSNSDGSLQPWIAKTSLPVALSRHHAVFLNGYLYVFAGLSSDDALNQKVYSASVDANFAVSSWKTVGNTQARLNGGVGLINNAVVLVGGHTFATPVELTGTSDFTNGSATVAGTGTNYDGDLTIGDLIRNSADGYWYRVVDIDSDTSLTLEQPYLGADDAGATADGAIPTYLDSVEVIPLAGGSIGKIVVDTLPYDVSGASVAVDPGDETIYVVGGRDSDDILLGILFE